MKIERSALDGVLVIEPRRFGDVRGFFLESYQEKRYRDAGISDVFVQDNHSRSMRNVLRGMHFTVKKPQAQIVTVMRGWIFDACVDLRPQSGTFGQWFGAELGDEGPCQIYMAPGIAHGFCVLSDFADLHYKVSEFYAGEDEGGLHWADPDVGVKWPVSAPLVSERDDVFPRLRDMSAEHFPHMGK